MDIREQVKNAPARLKRPWTLGLGAGLAALALMPFAIAASLLGWTNASQVLFYVLGTLATIVLLCAAWFLIVFNPRDDSFHDD